MRRRYQRGLGLRELIMILVLVLVLGGLTGYIKLNGGRELIDKFFLGRTHTTSNRLVFPLPGDFFINIMGIALGLFLLYIGYRLDDLLRGAGGAYGLNEQLVSDYPHDIAYQVKPGDIGALGHKHHDYQVNRLPIR